VSPSPNGGPVRVAILAEDARAAEKLRALLVAAGYSAEAIKARAKPEDVAGTRPTLVVVQSDAVKHAAASCSKLRGASGGESVPLLCLCQKAAAADAASILDAGADDCLAKPFTPELFLARVRALLRRSRWSEQTPETRLKAGAVELSLLERTAAIDGRALELTRLEFELLAYLAARPGQAVTRAELLQAVWNYPADIATRTLDKHVESLRKKLEPQSSMIETVRAVGYRISPKK
jgi:two-component system alkaline phosphatase synthesis response regulator PhoP